MGALCDGDILLLMSVRLSVVCKIFEVIRYVAAPGGEWRLIVSTGNLLKIFHETFRRDKQ